MPGPRFRMTDRTGDPITVTADPLSRSVDLRVYMPDGDFSIAILNPENVAQLVAALRKAAAWFVQ